MKLTYRGIETDWQPLEIDIQLGDTGGKYRAQNWHYRYLRHVPEQRSRSQRTYRGATCNPSTTLQAAHPATPLDEQQPLHETTSSFVRTSVQGNLERRLIVARSKGDERLVQPLPLGDECRQLSLK
ncbi:hypothetical protein KR51_00009280 [Rubidibacter lacunae KORDI 51-2]|uniref:Uncharacterized protein n=1 Tax=Rubidibacter lacunae KORDI 51-2 TaxID=582515 RepID=U5DRT9_9CHRO|nr:DUF4278 domain-containing protein [Rubidibacter lacunae]ERN42405.1 hypothetical protein KR51_00009280 [Rubidibacter lacunae KORDI 51-2]